MADSWETIADWYAQQLQSGSAMHDFARDILLEHLPGHLTDQHVLDLGCGEGLIARAVAARGASVRGIDPSPRMIQHAQQTERRRPSGAVFAIDDGCSLATVSTGSVDWVTAGLSLNNVPDLDAALTAVNRVLTPGGSLLWVGGGDTRNSRHFTAERDAQIR